MTYPVQVMCARDARELPVGDRYAYEPKLDGVRCVAFQGIDRRAILQSQDQRSLTSRFQDVADAVRQLVPAGTVLDGELVVLNDGRPDFVALQHRMVCTVDTPSAHFVAFDVLSDRGRDVRGRRYLERRARLEDLVGAGSAGVGLIPMTTEYRAAKAWLAEHTEAGIEGVVAKRVNHRYIPRTPRAWTKVRNSTTAAAIVGGVTGTLEEPTGLVLGRHDREGRLRLMGRTFALPEGARSGIGRLLIPAGTEHPWPRVIPGGRLGVGGSPNRAYIPVQPTLVVEVEVDAAHEGRWRGGARFVRARWDLSAQDVITV